MYFTLTTSFDELLIQGVLRLRSAVQHSLQYFQTDFSFYLRLYRTSLSLFHAKKIWLTWKMQRWWDAFGNWFRTTFKFEACLSVRITSVCAWFGCSFLNCSNRSFGIATFQIQLKKIRQSVTLHFHRQLKEQSVAFVGRSTYMFHRTLRDLGNSQITSWSLHLETKYFLVHFLRLWWFWLWIPECCASHLPFFRNQFRHQKVANVSLRLFLCCLLTLRSEAVENSA